MTLGHGLQILTHRTRDSGVYPRPRIDFRLDTSRPAAFIDAGSSSWSGRVRALTRAGALPFSCAPSAAFQPRNLRLHALLPLSRYSARVTAMATNAGERAKASADRYASVMGLRRWEDPCQRGWKDRGPESGQAPSSLVGTYSLAARTSSSQSIGARVRRSASLGATSAQTYARSMAMGGGEQDMSGEARGVPEPGVARGEPLALTAAHAGPGTGCSRQ